ncbi:guanine deaminase-like [Glandiceps talaboti]
MTSNNNVDLERSCIFCGSVVHSTNTSPLVVLHDAIIGVQGGKVLFVKDKSELSSLAKEYDFNPKEVRHMPKGQFLIPGFVDTHIHAPQYVMAGTALDLTLLDWLNKYTFPTESKYTDKEFAARVYAKVVDRTVKYGTTTACYFATTHTDASLILADIVDRVGQRAFIGKVNMDQNTPDYCIESTDESIKETERFIKEMQKQSYGKITAVVTPRFAVGCSFKAMQELAKLAEKYDLPIQTHIAETKDECALVSKSYPNCKNYADVYYKTNLLTNRTILAHCIYMSDGELKQIKEKDAGVSHCPNSNAMLKSGILDVRDILNRGIKIGLGTDVSGGYSPSILDAIRFAVGVSKLLAVQKESKDYVPITVAEAFRMATLGGSQVLGLEDKIGNFEIGKEFDALLIDTKCDDSPFDTFDDDYQDSFMDVFQKFLFLGDDRNISEVYVGGARIYKRGSVMDY